MKAGIRMIAKGKDIYLRNIKIADVNGKYLKWLLDPDVNRFLEIRHRRHSIESIKTYVKKIMDSRDEFLWAICINGTGIHIGNIKLGPMNAHHGFADLGLLIGEKEYWGKGYATQAIALASAYAFDTLKLHKLRAGYYAENKGSARAFAKSGFRLEGCLVGQWQYNGQFMDQIVVGRINDHPKSTT